jgi:hypothetical protein
MQTFFAAPHLWWWGRNIPDTRWALWTGIVLLVATLIHKNRSGVDRPRTRIHTVAGFMLLNATIVHVFLAVDHGISLDTYTELFKFTLLAYLIWASIENERDFQIALMALAVGGFYIGWEVTINGRGNFTGSRLEGVGAPGADASNSLACLLLLTLPLAASLFVYGTWRQNWKSKLFAAVSAPLILNVVLLCNSRGAFLGLIGAGLSFVVLARGAARKKALGAIALGAVALFLLLGDPKIMDRFSTTFVGSEERDNSAESRLLFWKAGFLQLADYPLGAGGGSFKYRLGRRYQLRVMGAASEDAADRSLHNGYLTEATDWGFQGLALKMAFIFIALASVYRTVEQCRKRGRTDLSLIGLCILSSAAGFLISTMFGAFLNSEWAFWLVGYGVSYAELFADPAPAAAAPVPLAPQLRGGPRAA